SLVPHNGQGTRDKGQGTRSRRGAMILAWLGKRFKGEAREEAGRGGTFVPRVEGLEERWVPAAVRQQLGFRSLVFPTGTNLSVPTAIGFNINFYGTTTNSVFINTNGNVSLTSPLNFFTVGGPFQSIGTPLIAPYYANVDTTGGGQITYGQDVIG